MRPTRPRALVLVAGLCLAWLPALPALPGASGSEAGSKAESTVESPRSEQSAPRSESLIYRWSLEGVSGTLLRLLRILPTSGDAQMKLEVDDDELALDFTATSPKADPDEYWRYNARVRLPAWQTLAVRERVKYGKKDREKSFDLRNLEVLDVFSGLQFLRYRSRAPTERRTIWSDGKRYPVLVTRGGIELRKVGDRSVPVRHLQIRGVRVPRERLWNASAELWLTADATAVPIEMLYRQSLGRLRLTLVEHVPELPGPPL